MLAGRSNVGKSSLINALTRQSLARTSAEPGKTRLANVYEIARGDGAGRTSFYLIDLPGYGYARGGNAGFDALVKDVFARNPAALLLVDVRHPALESDRHAWGWISASDGPRAVVATKIDKLARGERIRAMRQLESVYDGPVAPVSAASGEGMDELWKLIVKLLKPRPTTSPSA